MGVPSPYDGIGRQEPAAAISIYLACGSTCGSNIHLFSLRQHLRQQYPFI